MNCWRISESAGQKNKNGNQATRMYIYVYGWVKGNESVIYDIESWACGRSLNIIFQRSACLPESLSIMLFCYSCSHRSTSVRVLSPRANPHSRVHSRVCFGATVEHSQNVPRNRRPPKYNMRCAALLHALHANPTPLRTIELHFLGHWLSHSTQSVTQLQHKCTESWTSAM